MARVKRGVIHAKKRRNLLRHTKGYRNKRNTKLRLARVAFLKAGTHAYIDRRRKKRNARRLWNVRVNAAARLNGTKYSTLIHALNKAGVLLDRKILAELGANYPAVFSAVVHDAQKEVPK